jgi:purine-nucleoside phosphorylase
MIKLFDKIKMELLNFGLKFISVDEKLVRLFLETKPSDINETVILPASKMVMKKLVSKIKNKRKYGKVYNGLLNDKKVSIILSHIGAPNTAIIMECLKRTKAKKVIRVDFCGGIELEEGSVQVGEIFIPKIAYCGDGTSAQYILKNSGMASQLNSIKNPLSQYQEIITGSQEIFSIGPNPELKELALTEGKDLLKDKVKEIDLWTTDALFCETFDFIKALRSINVEGIDMETSILFLLGKFYNLNTLSILSVSDIPGSEYDITKSNQIHPDMEKGINLAIKLVETILPKI